VPAGNDLEREQVAERLLVELDLARPYDLRQGADDDERRDPQGLERRRRRCHLHVRVADAVLRIAIADASVGPLDAVDGDLLFENLARSVREAAADDARLDRFVHRRVGLLSASVGGEVVCPERGNEDGRVEEDRPLDELGVLRGDVHRQPAAEAVADPVRGPVKSLEQVGHVGGDVPWLFPG
jgi:hypothetical protein